MGKPICFFRFSLDDFSKCQVVSIYGKVKPRFIPEVRPVSQVAISQSQHPKSPNQSQESHGLSKKIRRVSMKSFQFVFMRLPWTSHVVGAGCGNMNEAANLRKDYNELQIIIRHLHHDWLWYIYIYILYIRIYTHNIGYNLYRYIQSIFIYPLSPYTTLH